MTRALQRWKPRPSEETLGSILNGLEEPILNAKFALKESATFEVKQYRRRLERIRLRAKQLRRDLEGLAPLEAQIPLGDLLRYLDAHSPREIAQDLAKLEQAAEDVRPGRQTVGHPKAGTTATRYLASQVAAILDKHGIRASSASGSIWEAIVRATWTCVADSPPPNNMTRFLGSIPR